MRILFLLSGDMWVHNLPQGFNDLGHEIKLSGEITKKNTLGIISEFKPHLLISLGWGYNQCIYKQKIFRKYIKPLKIPHVYWSIEDPAFTRAFSLPLIHRIKPDFVFSICNETVKYFRENGIKAAYMDYGYSPKIHKPVKAIQEYNSSIVIVANAYPRVLKNNPNHYRHTSLKTLAVPLLKKGIKIDFWGREWENMKEIIDYDIPNKYIHGYLQYVNANKVYSSADIIIGLQNYTTQVTQRTYEILASEGFLLTSDTKGVKKSFKHGKHLIVSSSPEETLELVNYYLKNPNERVKIKKEGATAVIGNTYKDRARYMIDVLRREKIIKA